MRDSASLRMTTPEVIVKIRPRRPVEGISSVLVSFTEDGAIDFDSLAENILRTADAGLTPAVNIERLTPVERRQVLDLARDVLVTRTFVSGAYIGDQDGDVLDLYRESVATIIQDGGTPIVIPTEQLGKIGAPAIIRFYETLATEAQSLLAYEVDPALLPGGRIYSAETIGEIMAIPNVVGLRHSSLNRRLEWERLTLRDYVRPSFRIYSGNDVAIDMMMYGSDYFLSVSACAPEAFALRDRYWRDGDARFYELNDVLQSLGMLAFRPPVAAARHSASQMLKLRGRIDVDRTAPDESKRPASDVEVLSKIIERLDHLQHIGHIHS